MTIAEIKRLQEDFDRAHAGSSEFYEKINDKNLHVLEHLIVCLVGEIGEFSNLIKKVHRGDIPLTEAKSSLDEEAVDMFIYLVKIINQFDVDIEHGFLNKLEKNRNRFLKYKK